MKKSEIGAVDKIAQNADFAQSERPENPDIAGPWFLRPCLRPMYPVDPVLRTYGFETAALDIRPKVALYNLVDGTPDAGKTETGDMMTALREYARRFHYFVVDELCDCGCGEDLVRPGLSGLLEMAEKKRISGVLTVSPSTISQNLYQLLAYREALERYGVWIRFCDF